VSRGRDNDRGLVISIALALALELLPLPELVDPFRPYWVGLVMIYWSLETTETINLGMAFLIGLLLDLITGSLMGLHALSLVVLVYLVQRFRARLRFFPPWQQALSVLGLLVNDRIIMLWITNLLGEPATTWQFWLPPLSGLIMWPWLFLMLDRLRIGRRINKP
jgi:rod shape-determining protein MreD